MNFMFSNAAVCCSEDVIKIEWCSSCTWVLWDLSFSDCRRS